MDTKSKYADVILKPRITEKASYMSQQNVYTFEIREDADKKAVIGAVKAFYNVAPVKVTVARNPDKNVFVRGKKGVKKGVKKAYVYLKEGETLNLG